MASFSHLKLKLRLGMMRFRIKHPALNLGVKFLLLVVLIAACYFSYTLWRQSKQSLTTNNEPVIKIQTYSLNGEVISTKPDELIIKTDILENRDGANILVPHQRTVIITPSTEVVKIAIRNNEVTTIPATTADLKIKKTIAVYGNADPLLEQPFSAEKIEIIE